MKNLVVLLLMALLFQGCGLDKTLKSLTSFYSKKTSSASLNSSTIGSEEETNGETTDDGDGGTLLPSGELVVYPSNGATNIAVRAGLELRFQSTTTLSTVKSNFALVAKKASQYCSVGVTISNGLTANSFAIYSVSPLSYATKYYLLFDLEKRNLVQGLTAGTCFSEADYNAYIGNTSIFQSTFTTASPGSVGNSDADDEDDDDDNSDNDDEDDDNVIGGQSFTVVSTIPVDEGTLAKSAAIQIVTDQVLTNSLLDKIADDNIFVIPYVTLISGLSATALKNQSVPGFLALSMSNNKSFYFVPSSDLVVGTLYVVAINPNLTTDLASAPTAEALAAQFTEYFMFTAVESSGSGDSDSTDDNDDEGNSDVDNGNTTNALTLISASPVDRSIITTSGEMSFIFEQTITASMLPQILANINVYRRIDYDTAMANIARLESATEIQAALNDLMAKQIILNATIDSQSSKQVNFQASATLASDEEYYVLFNPKLDTQARLIAAVAANSFPSVNEIYSEQFTFYTTNLPLASIEFSGLSLPRANAFAVDGTSGITLGTTQTMNNVTLRQLAKGNIFLFKTSDVEYLILAGMEVDASFVQTKSVPIRLELSTSTDQKRFRVVPLAPLANDRYVLFVNPSLNTNLAALISQGTTLEAMQSTFRYSFGFNTTTRYLPCRSDGSLLPEASKTMLTYSGGTFYATVNGVISTALKEGRWKTMDGRSCVFELGRYTDGAKEQYIVREYTTLSEENLVLLLSWLGLSLSKI